MPLGSDDRPQLPRLKFIQAYRNRHGRWVIYFRRGRGDHIRLPDDPASRAFRVAYDAALEGRPIPHVRDMPSTAAMLRKQRTERTLRQAVTRAKARSRAMERPFSLTLDWALEQAEAQDFRCALTGIEFFAKSPSGGTRDPYVPSLDRIDPKGGYTTDNVRIIINALNIMLSDWGEPLFTQVANSYRYWQRTNRVQSNPAPSIRSPAPNK